MKRLLEERHGQRLAIIENELGEENIDKEFLVSCREEQICTSSRVRLKANPRVSKPTTRLTDTRWAMHHSAKRTAKLCKAFMAAPPRR
ncbi:GTP-binding protein [Pseudomonas sp. RIT623]|uniref:GTP-binding protein n=1 Tax=Pseudomonas sp. RIT623 TaxID=2559075 RepID=UPI0021143085|nr:GTP-binding protein [Pseudomonas sp. RIT623]